MLRLWMIDTFFSGCPQRVFVLTPAPRQLKLAGGPRDSALIGFFFFLVLGFDLEILSSLLAYTVSRAGTTSPHHS